MIFEILTDYNKTIPTPFDHFLALLVTGLVFIFFIGLYGVILCLGKIEALAELENEE